MLARMSAKDEPVDPEWLIPLIDCEVVVPTRQSCVAAALREARGLVGRRPEDGRLVDPKHGLTWAGALVYLIYCEQIGSCFRPAGSERPRKKKALADALIWFGGSSDEESRALEELRNRLAHDYTLRSTHPDGYRFVLTGSASEPVCTEIGTRTWAVGLPALALRVETVFNSSLLLLADEGRLLCHHPGGTVGVESRFFMGMVGTE